MPEPSPSHLLLVPSYNTGPGLLQRTLEATLAHWAPVWVILDGSTDGSEAVLKELAAKHPPEQFRFFVLPDNRGKGAAIETALEPATAAGFTHVLTFDADGQHPADLVPLMMATSRDRPEAMILGHPVFGPEAPAIRLQGRKLSNGLVRLETLSGAVGDALFGFRLYPIEPLRRAFTRTRGARRYDFEPEMVVRLAWDGVPVLNFNAPCRYVSADDEGVSHFHYLRDNLHMIALHARLLSELPRQLPGLLRRR